MDDVEKTKQKSPEEENVPHGGMPGDGAGRIEDPGTRHAGVWPVSGPPSGNPEARTHGMASFGQGERGAAGYEDSGQSEVFYIPPEETTTAEEQAAGSTASHAEQPAGDGGDSTESTPG